VAIIVAALATTFTNNAWPDLITGLAISIVNMDAAREAYSAAVKERAEALKSKQA